MTPGELAALILAAAALLTALGGFAVQVATLYRMTHVQRAVNGQSDALTALTGKASYAEGLLAGSAAVRESLVDTPSDRRGDPKLPQ